MSNTVPTNLLHFATIRSNFKNVFKNVDSSDALTDSSNKHEMKWIASRQCRVVLYQVVKQFYLLGTHFVERDKFMMRIV